MLRAFLMGKKKAVVAKFLWVASLKTQVQDAPETDHGEGGYAVPAPPTIELPVTEIQE
ncbi:MAG: hypothetical protein WC455_28875 [Dehalococcoidia bacterium]|jgi:hypothetical protein